MKPEHRPSIYDVDPDHFQTVDLVGGPVAGKKIFLTDVDGVLVNWGIAFEEWIVKKFGYHPYDGVGIHAVNDLRYWLFPNADDAQLVQGRKLIEEFQMSQHAETLPVYEDAKEYLPKIAALGYQFIAISAAGTLPGIAERRVQLLLNHFPMLFTRIHVLPPVVSKRTVLQLYDPALWVDDHIKHTLAGRECGHTSFHLERPNGMHVPHEGDPDANFVSSWRDIYHGI